MPYQSQGLSIEYNLIPHLFVVMNDPCKDNMCLLVMISSIKEGRFYDDACVLNAGDHPYITHDSYLVYRIAETYPSDRIERFLSSGFYIQKEDFDHNVFKRIATGLYRSDETKQRILTYAQHNKI